ncbi:serine hydrolase [Prauserella muralis]|uniref:Serine hydrolase n=1 Tax=Prauserella muralis TaxID=588067 RepID=A0A2V4ANH7_9PSEU|nr:serine hydrolase [Prauserella muralis]PXY20676.1 serine hydrolase [Prauserella muralis]TWE29671.1 beta-lactamase class A [Prauserella muralis]
MTIPDLFDAAGVHGWVHARCLGTGAETGFGADEPVVLASVIKVPLVLEFARQVAEGQLEPTDRVRVREVDRLGGTGTAGCADDVELSLRDVARFALTVSDNTAADLLFDRVGVDNVRSLLAELGLRATTVAGPPRDIVRAMASDVGAADLAEFARRFPTLTDEQLLATRALDPIRTTASTPMEMTRLLALIWSGEAAPPQACRQVRALMAQQVSWARLGAAFAPDATVAGKTGTLPCVRNEIGVVDYPDGGRYAVAVFTRGGGTRPRPDIERAIGAAARHAVEELRRARGPGTVHPPPVSGDTP